MKPILYKIINKTNRHWYVGSAKSKTRFNGHRHALRKNKHHCPRLQNAWNRYGEERFDFRIINEYDDRNKALYFEQKCLDKHFGKEYCYNAYPFTCENRFRKKGKGHSEETKQKISKANKGKRLGIKDSKETKKRKSEAVKLRYSLMSDEEKKIFGAHCKGKHLSLEAIENIRQKNTGKIFSEERKKSISEGKKKSTKFRETFGKIKSDPVLYKNFCKEKSRAVKKGWIKRKLNILADNILEPVHTTTKISII